jgi:hypothetical protein
MLTFHANASNILRAALVAIGIGEPTRSELLHYKVQELGNCRFVLRRNQL